MAQAGEGQVAGGLFDTQEQVQRALDLGYAYLNQRDRTVHEVRRQLERKGVSEEVTGATIDTLTAQGFIDDARFARLFVSDKRELEQWGAERIRRGLLARGIDRQLAEAALDDERADPGRSDGELVRAVAVLRRRFPTPPEDRRGRDRALGILLRKGYDSEVALDALAAHARGEP
jgi:regulatory protein